MREMDKIIGRRLIPFLLGYVIGIIFTVIFFFVIGKSSLSAESQPAPITKLDSRTTLLKDPGLTLFSKPGEIMPLKSFKVFQVLDKGWALAESSEREAKNAWFDKPIVLLKPIKQKPYYDYMVISLSPKQTSRQIGTYRYETKNEFIKTVPVIEICENYPNDINQ